MIARFFLFEVRYWLRQPMVYIFLSINALLIGLSVVFSENVSVGGGVGNVLVNSPFVVYQYYGVMSFIGLLMVTAFVNATAIRDFTSNTAQIVFSTPVSKAGYLIGKFLGSTFVATLPLIGVSLGLIVGSWWPSLDPLRVGPNVLGSHAQAFLLIGLPNVLFSAAIIFAVAVLARTTMASFITAIALIVGYSVAGSFITDIENETLGAMLDPFGSTATNLATKYWTVEDKNTLLLPSGGLLLWNRLLWIGVSIVIFLFGYLRFSFTERVQKATASNGEGGAAAASASLALPRVSLHYTASAARKQFLTLFNNDLRSILKSTPFIIIITLGLLQLFTSLSFVTSMYGNTTYPVTYSVIDLMRGSLFIYLMIIVTFYGGQLVWKERDPKMDGITNALPMATYTGLLAKLAALTCVVLVVHLVGSAAGMVTQLANGYTRLQPGLYLTYFIVPGTLNFLLWSVLAFLVHVLVNNKYLGFFVFIVLVVLNLFAWSAVDVSSNLMIINGSSGLNYSDMSGYGPFLKGWLFFKAYWLVFAAILVFVSYLFLVRGNDTSFRWRMHEAKQRLSGSKGLAFGLAGLWLLLGAWGVYNTKFLNTYTTSDDGEQQRVDYEKTYKRYEHMVHPRYTDIAYTIDLVPEERAMSYMAEITLKNKSAQPIDTLYFSLPGDMDPVLEIPGATVVLNDTVLDQRMYRLSPPLAPGADLRMTVKGSYRAKGIENEISFVQLVQNGTFFNNMALLPSIGYNAGGELTDRADRRKYDLPPNDRMPKLSDDPAKRMQNYLLANSDWVNVRTTISTAPDQIAIAPGSKTKEWEANGRRYFTYVLEQPSLNFYSFLSARYEVATEKWNPGTGPGQAVDLEVYYQKEHGVNVPRMLNSMKRSLAYYSRNFGPYRHKQARIIEFSSFQGTFAQAFPGTMPYSESIGFITDLTAEEDIDMVFYVVAHEMGHQWWAHQVMGAEMQGSTMLSESMAQYSALMVMEEEYGKAHMRKFLKYEGDKYQNARGAEAIGETPLMYVENQGYIHYNKASVVLYCMRDFLGEDTLNKAFHALVDSFAYAEPPWPTALDMYREIAKVTPDSLTYLLEDNFKYITLYNNGITSASATMNADSSWSVSVSITADKVHADSLGKETKVPVNDWMDIAVERKPAFGRNAKKELNDVPLVQQRVKLRTGANSFTFTVPEKPLAVVIDPDHLFFDRMPEDNRKKVD